MNESANRLHRRQSRQRRVRAGDLVRLRSGGPVMTVDAINTSVFDDKKITGLSCVWFVGSKLERVRFDPSAVVVEAEALSGDVLVLPNWTEAVTKAS